MFSNETPSPYARVVTATAYGTGMVVGTALLIAVSSPELEQWQGEGASPTRAEAVMQGAMQKALASPRAAVMAANELHERRGL
jgi:hypothetical protein